MDIGIIGSGNIGTILVRQLTALGHTVSIANSQGPDTLSDIAAETGARAATAEEAAGAKDMVILAVTEIAVPKLPRDVLAQSKAIIVDSGNYFPSRDGIIQGIEDGFIDSEWVASVIGHNVVKAFNNIVAHSLEPKTAPVGSAGRVAISVSGNSKSERRSVIDLIDAIGFDAVDNGPLSESWRHQPGTPAYCRDLDVKALEAAHLKAQFERIAEYRKAQDDIAAPFFRGEKRVR